MQQTYIMGYSYMARRLGAANLHHGVQLHGKKVRCSKPTSWGTATWKEGKVQQTYIMGHSYMARRLGAANLHHGAQLHGKKVRCSKPTSWGIATWQEG